MCHQCNYEALLNASDLTVTENRLRVLEAIGNNDYPLSVGDIYRILERGPSINRVTVYRIIDLLVDRKVVERLSTGGRAFYYGIAPNDYHRTHPHFYCKNCGQMDCLDPESLAIETDALWKTFPGRIDKVEVRVDGICKNCMK
jgi:Fur family ferric uptake transcriptional regulator